jgi:hypothetical protein
LLKRTCQETATAATAVSFPQDVVREILVRVEDAAALLLCHGVHAVRRLMAKASFLRHRWQDPNASAFLFGSFTPKRLTLTDLAAATTRRKVSIYHGRKSWLNGRFSWLMTL